MGTTVRFGVSMDADLVALLDRLTSEQGHTNRSETLRQLVRRELIEAASTDDAQPVLGTLTFLYRSGTRLPRLTIAGYPSLSISANLQLHVSEEICVKLLVLRGTGRDVRGWARGLLSCKRIVGKLSIAAIDDLTCQLR